MPHLRSLSKNKIGPSDGDAAGEPGCWCCFSQSSLARGANEPAAEALTWVELSERLIVPRTAQWGPRAEPLMSNSQLLGSD